MRDKILIPLDGSPFSDQILSLVMRLYEGRKSPEVVLLRALPHSPTPEEERGKRVDMPDEGDYALRRQAGQRHLKKLVDGLSDREATFDCHVVSGEPTDTILNKVRHMYPHLVAMATHGRSGPSRWIRGSVAERVLRRCPVPLLLWNPTHAREGEVVKSPRKVLVPLDGSDWSAKILDTVMAFLPAGDCSVVLFHAGSLPEGHSALSWLAIQEKRLKSAGFETSVMVVSGDPASVILSTIEQGDFDLVALTTHGRSGIGRWLFGSVAEKVLRACSHPLLVHRIADQEEVVEEEE